MDIGPYLVKGTNTITVEVATTLLNRLRSEDVAYMSAKRQAYGLVGPVTLAPYGEAKVYAQTAAGGDVGGSVPATLSLTVGRRVVRRVHAGRRAHLRGEHDRQRHLHGG